MVLKVYTGVHAQVNYDPVISSNIVILYTEYIALGMILLTQLWRSRVYPNLSSICVKQL